MTFQLDLGEDAEADIDDILERSVSRFGLSIVSDDSPAAGLLSPGTLALAGVGIVIVLACTAIAKRVAGPHYTAA